MKMKRNVNCFSLIEMLVIITVIMVLFALIVPAINSAKERARDVRCKNNLKELHAAAMSYSQRGADSYYGHKDLPRARSSEWFNDARDCFENVVGWVDWTQHPKNTTADQGFAKWWGPEAYQSITSDEKGGWHTSTLWEFTGKSLKIYCCPTFARSEVTGAKSPDNKTLTFNYDLTSPGVVLRNYGMNKAVSAVNPGSGADSRKILFADMASVTSTNGITIATRSLTWVGTFNRDFNNCWHVDGEIQTNQISGGYCRENVGTYHSGKGNAVFVDGHVEAIDPRDGFKAFTGNW